MQFAAAADLELVRALRRLNAQRDVVDQLLVEAFAQVPAGDVLALAPAERRVVDLEGHADGRLIDQQCRQRLNRVRIADGIGDLQPIDAGEGNNVAGFRHVQFDSLEPVEGENLQHAAAPQRAIGAGNRHLRVAQQAAAADPRDADDADVARIVERADLHLQRAIGIDLGGRYVAHDGIEQRRHATVANARVLGRPALDGRCIEMRKVHLLVRRPKPVEQVESLVDHPVGPGRRPVDLVDDDDRLQAARQRLAGDKGGLRHGPFDRVDQQQDRVHHRQRAFYLAAEICVSGGIDDVDPPAFPVDRRVLGEDGDAALALQIVGVHHPFLHVAVRPQAARLAQHLVDQCCLSVVNMRNDGDIAYAIGRSGHRVAPDYLCGVR